LCLDRNLTVGADSDPRTRVGNPITIEVKGDETVEPLARLRINNALLESINEPRGYVQELIVGPEHHLRPRILIFLTGVDALGSQRRSGYKN
jgi:hypothetical protein